MMRIVTAGALVASLGNAPLQCGHGSDSGVHEDSAGDALYALAQDFHAKGNEDASKQTLRYLVDHYPSNRHVPAARAELEGAGAPATTSDAGK
jgi:hypothetical protein